MQYMKALKKSYKVKDIFSY
ncbi:hypothetical protein CFP56_022406 [Quercus suber]|uniref:Uncharacterized protein n=1 Tax=Quercus suber TaxID=58331 RepID=A0AAW0KCK8_QUESU